VEITVPRDRGGFFEKRQKRLIGVDERRSSFNVAAPR
jgi:hypothetical protein